MTNYSDEAIRLGSLIASRVREHLLARTSSAHRNACLFSAWNLMTNWCNHFGKIAAQQRVDDETILARVDKWIDNMLAFVECQSPHVLGVKLRTMLMKGKP